MKNYSPLQIALLASLWISIISAIILLIIVVVTAVMPYWIILVIVFSLFLSSTFVIRYYTEKFIYRKIKLIYKQIHSMKFSSNEPVIAKNIDQNIFNRIEEEVKEWSDHKQNEIQKMQKDQAYRRKFLANVSHELKTPIFNIQGYLYTLIDSDLSDASINMKYLKKAASNLDQLSDIVSDLEIIAQLESGEVPINLIEFNILELVKDTLSDMELMAQKNNISLKIKEGCNKPQQVYADKEKIKQVLINLIANSIKYGKINGNTQIGIYDMASHVLVEVSDDGIGIAEKHLPHLFERFYRIDKSRSRQVKGSGLGLSIVKHLIEAHGQNLNVRSTPDVGSTFGFTLKKA